MEGSVEDATVVLPVWDEYVHLLPEAVESVRRNSPTAPIVVVDNASATPVPELEGCELVRASARLTEGAARNLGLERVATEYVVFLDADDMLLDGALDFLRDRIAVDRGLVVSACSILDGQTGERHRTPRPLAIRLANRPGIFALANSVWSLLPIQGCAVLRTDQVRDAGGYPDTNLGEDWDLAVSLAWRGRVAISERLGRYYRASEESPSRRARKPAELRASARRIRARMRSDAAVPRWGRVLLPAIALLQIAAIHLLRPLYLGVRRVKTVKYSLISRSGTKGAP